MANPRSLGGKLAPLCKDWRRTGIGENWEFCDSMLSESGFLVFLFVSVLFFVSNLVSVMVTAGETKKQQHCDKKINWLYMELFKYRSFPT